MYYLSEFYTEGSVNILTMPTTRSIRSQPLQQQPQDVHHQVINPRQPKSKAQKFNKDKPKSPQTQNFDSLLINRQQVQHQYQQTVWFIPSSLHLTDHNIAMQVNVDTSFECRFRLN